MTAYDPNTPNTLYFGNKSSSKAASELMKSNPTEYARRKELALAEGLIVRKDYQNPNFRDRYNPKQFTQDELMILASVPESETAKYFGSGAMFGAASALQKMATEEPARYNKLRASAMLRAFIPSAPIAPQPEPKPMSQFVTVSDADCDAAGLPHGYQTTAEGLETVKRVVQEVEQKRVEAERLATVTAEKLSRDARIDASVAEFGRLLDLNREISAKQRERDAEVAAA